MVVGLGIDVIQNERIRDSVTRFGTRFLNRIYTETEIAYCANCADPGIHYAARFAAKEAGFKALGTGWAAGVKWKDIEVRKLRLHTVPTAPTPGFTTPRASRQRKRDSKPWARGGPPV